MSKLGYVLGFVFFSVGVALFSKGRVAKGTLRIDCTKAEPPELIAQSLVARGAPSRGNAILDPLTRKWVTPAQLGKEWIQ